MRPLKAATEPMVTMRPRAPLHHAARHRLTGQDGGEQVAVQHRAHVLLADVDGIVRVGLAAGGGNVSAGIVYEDIDRPEPLRRGLDHPVNVGALGQIAEHADGADAVVAGHRLRDCGQGRPLAILRRAVLAHAMDGDIGAEAREPLGESAAEPASGAGYQCDLAR